MPDENDGHRPTSPTFVKMEHCMPLPEALDGLRLTSSGSHDYQARKDNLTSVAGNGRLTANEIQAPKVSTFQNSLRTDILARLPLELVILVTAYLDPDDIGVMLAVCKEWRTLISNDQVSAPLSKRLFPDLTYDTKNGMSFDRASSFVDAARQRLRRNKGRFHRFTSKDFGPLPCTVTAAAAGSSDGLPKLAKPTYAYGRMAYGVDCFTLVVDCFRERERKTFTVPNGLATGEGIGSVTLGDELVVVTLKKVLVAWNLNSGRLERMTLPPDSADPEYLTELTTLGKRVVVCTTEDVYLWEFGGKLQSFGLPALKPTLPIEVYKFDVMSPIFHPQDDHVIFFGHVCALDIIGGFITVLEFRDMRFVKAYSYGGTWHPSKGIHVDPPVSSSLLTPLRHEERRHFCEWCIIPEQKRSDAHGRYSLARIAFSDCPEEMERVPHFCMVQFDIYTKQFTGIFFENPPIWERCLGYDTHDRDPDVLFWNNRLVFAEMDPGRGVVVHQFESCDEEASERWDDGYDHWVVLNSRGGDQFHERETVLGKDCPIHKIFGDDDFVVFIEDYKYHVWEFKRGL